MAGVGVRSTDSREPKQKKLTTAIYEESDSDEDDTFEPAEHSDEDDAPRTGNARFVGRGQQDLKSSTHRPKEAPNPKDNGVRTPANDGKKPVAEDKYSFAPKPRKS